MDSIDRLLKISSRLDHLENAAEWIARETVHTDNTVSQTGTLLCVLADELREKIYSLVHDLEKDLQEASRWELSPDKLH